LEKKSNLRAEKERPVPNVKKSTEASYRGEKGWSSSQKGATELQTQTKKFIEEGKI